MANLILRGGLMRLNHSAYQFKPVNITLLKSPTWLCGIISIKNLPYFRVLPYRDNYIEIKTVNEKHFLLVNDRDIYRSYDNFDYTINVRISEHMRHKSYPDFYRYY